ncbi:DUF503 family protein [Hydrogenimonas sp. SS33]|uniref:DUF503 family protein n=1 Tax=Hydrogenimonas leucolamina TaxID=2954236 RepID=UPI00336C1A75
MTLTYATLTIDLPYVSSKKGRRALLNAIKERLSRMNCSVLDLSGEYPKEAVVAVAFLTPTGQDADAKIEAIEQMLASRFPDLEVTIDYEAL